MTRCLAWALLALSGCLNDQLIPCGDTLCPTNYSCDTERSICIDPNGLSVPADTIDFGNVACNTTATGTLAIRNFSANAISYSAVSTIPGVTASPSAGEFPAGGTVELALEATVPLESIPASTIAGTLLIAAGNDVVERDVVLTPEGALLDTSVLQLDFGEGTLGNSDTRSITITNSGTAPIDLAPALRSTVPAPITATPVFALVNPDPVHVGPGATGNVAVQFAPDQLVSFTSSVDLAPSGSLCQMPLRPVNLSGAATMDEILVDHLTLDFGDAACGAPASTLPLRVTNNVVASSVMLTSTITGTAAGLFDPVADAIVPAMGMVDLPITRAAIPATATPGGRSATLTVVATGGPGATKVIALAQSITAPVLAFDRACIDVDMIAPHATVNRMITLTNTGNGVANVTSIPAEFVQGPLHVTISPSAFQIQPGGAIVLTAMVENTSSLGIALVKGSPAFTFTAVGECGDPPILTLGCF